MILYGDLETFFHDEADKKVFRVKSKQSELSASSINENNSLLNFCQIVEVITLDNSDYMIGFRGLCIKYGYKDETKDKTVVKLECFDNDIHYYNFSDICLSDVTVDWDNLCKREKVER